MKTSLNAIAAAIRAATEPKAGGDRQHYFPISKAPTGSTQVLRLLPDGNAENIVPFVEEYVIRMPFTHSINSDYPVDGDCTVVLPCAKTWGLPCQISAATRHLWKGSAEQQAIARLYYPKRSYIYQGFVVSSPVVEDETPDNPIRKFKFSTQIHSGIVQGFTEPQFDENPLDYDEGHDFRVVKGTQGGFASYTKSAFAIKPRPLSETERQALATHGLFVLADLIGAAPDPSTWDMTKEMLADSLSGEPFDARKYAPFRAFSVAPNNAQAPSSAGAASSVDRPASDNNDIVARLRARQRVA